MIELPFWLLMLVFIVGSLSGVAAVFVPLYLYEEKNKEEDEDKDPSDLFI